MEAAHTARKAATIASTETEPEPDEDYECEEPKPEELSLLGNSCDQSLRHLSVGKTDRVKYNSLEFII